MRHSLYGKLAAALLVMLMLTGAMALAITWVTARYYFEEIHQKLNRNIARHVVAEKPLIQGNTINQDALAEWMHMIMLINPGVELYLLDTRGQLLAHAAPPGKVKRAAVAMGPVHNFVEGTARFPLYGDDPRDGAGRKVFSAAPVMDGNRVAGYLYVILNSEEYESMANRLSGSFILHVSLWMIAAVLLIAFLSGLLMFKALTRKLQHLAFAIQKFRDTEMPLSQAPWKGGGDEIQRLNELFNEMARKLKDQMHTLSRIDRQRRDLVANVSHDLRTPLATLQAYLETLCVKNDTLNGPGRLVYLRKAGKHCQYLNRRIDELLALSKLDLEEVTLKYELINLPELVQDVLVKFKVAAGAKHIRFHLKTIGSIPPIRADIGLIERVLDNLLGNALRYTPVYGSIGVTLQVGRQSVAIDIRDSGPGISPSDLPHIFERCYQGDSGHKPAPGSSGLGLAIAQQILRLHGGDIHVRSTSNRGTTFRFYLPLGTPSRQVVT